MTAAAAPTDVRRTARRATLVCALALALLATAGAASPAETAGTAAAAPHRVTWDKHSLMIDGERLYVWSAEFHYWRLPSPDLWRDVLEKLKAGGFNTVSIYFDWGYHSPKPGVYDFTGVRDVERLLDIAQEVGIYVIARPGPYINAETDSGGFPGWVVTQQGTARTAAADYLAAADEWLTKIDAILRRHQITDGGGPIILYQVENEYFGTDSVYMQHLVDKVRADGITVPTFHNDVSPSGRWRPGTAGAPDLYAWDGYPQGFDCSSPTSWSSPPGYGSVRQWTPGGPMFIAEFQGGAFDAWAGPGYENCRIMTGPDFEKVFYKNNIASGVTMQSFYMTFGGTSWGWLPDAARYTSYDYGAAITEPRQLTTKYDELKRQGYFVQAVEPLAKTEAFAPLPPSNSAILAQGRVNPDDGTQFLVLRHSDGRSTSNDTTRVSIDLGRRVTYTYDDRDPALEYTSLVLGATWRHIGPESSSTSGDYQRTRSFSNVAGDSVSITFNGTAVRWISSTDSNHGIADVYLDGTKVATVDGYGTPKRLQQVFYSASGLAVGEHVLRIVVTGTRNASSSGDYVTVDAIDVPPPGAEFYPSVPQQAGTAIRLNGRDSKILVVNYALESQRLVYSTSELMTHSSIGGRDVALLYGRSGESGETVLRYETEPTVTTLSGAAPTVTWDGGIGDFRLNYTHGGLTEVLVSGGGTAQPLLLILADDATAATFWRHDTAAGPVLERGPGLVRTAVVDGPTLALTGDTSAASPLEVWAPDGVTGVTWNGSPVAVSATPSGSLLAGGPLAGPPSIALPALASWKYAAEAPEAQPGFDDSTWALADHLTTNNPAKPAADQPVLYADDYGFHHGDVWYRGHFTGTGSETSVTLTATTGNRGTYAAWLNGTYLGSLGAASGSLTIPVETVRVGADNVLAVLVRNMGHNGDWSANDGHKEPRGLRAATVNGEAVSTPLGDWRIQGNQGGEDLTDVVRGPMNNGGLYGERAGWYLPGYPDGDWTPVSLPFSDTRAGVAWYRATFALDLPPAIDASLGLTISDPAAKVYRAQIFVNGWNLGQYINNVGPQHTFVLPNGILNTNGANTLALAVITNNAGGGSTGGGLGTVTLTNLGTVASRLQVGEVESPAYEPPVVEGGDVSAVEQEEFSGPVATVAVSRATEATVLSATIDWGDGSSPSAGTLSGPAGSRTVSGTHTYARQGRYLLRVTVLDAVNGSELASGSGSATVVGVNEPPDAVDDAASVFRGGSVDVAVLANDADPDGDAVTVASFSQGTNGSVSENPDGSLRYTHDASLAKSDSFSYTISDGRGGSDTATVTVAVTEPVEGTETTGGGWLASSSGGKLNFGYNVKAVGEGVEGDLKLNDKAAGVKIQASTMRSIGPIAASCGGVPASETSLAFAGSGAFNGAAASFRACVQDNAGAGGADRFYVECTSGCAYNTAARVPDNLIDGGNIQVRQAASAFRRASGTSSTAGSSSAAAAEAQPTTMILDPLLLTEGVAGLVQVFTVAVYDQNQRLLPNASVGLTATTSSGSHTLTAVTDVAGKAFILTINPAGEVEYIATAGATQSNTIQLTLVPD